MITIENRYFPLRSLICFFVEGVIIFLSVITSFIILQRIGKTGIISFEEAILRGLIVAFFCQFCMYMFDLYDLKISRSWGEIVFSLMFAVGFICIGVGLLSYVVPKFGVVGQMYYLTVFFVALFLFFWRIVFRIYLITIAPRENILIVGTGDAAKFVAKEIWNRGNLGFHLIGFVGTKSEDDNYFKENGGILGDQNQIKQLVRQNRIDKVVVAIEDRRGEYPVEEMLSLKASGVGVVEWPAFFEKLSGRIPINNLAPSFFIFNDGFRKTKFSLFFRRITSMIISVVGIMFLLPIFLLIGVIIKLDSPGPVFYCQKRVGQRGKIFRIMKFRSMMQDAEPNGEAQWATRNDRRITRIGRILRLTRIDELPQLFNMLRGDLDLVGPRPERPEFVSELKKIIPYYSLRHTVKPGLTGWAQIMFPYSGTVEESKEKLQYDLFYIKNMSIKLDLLIIISTLKIVLLGRGAR